MTTTNYIQYNFTNIYLPLHHSDYENSDYSTPHLPSFNQFVGELSLPTLIQKSEYNLLSKYKANKEYDSELTSNYAKKKFMDLTSDIVEPKITQEQTPSLKIIKPIISKPLLEKKDSTPMKRKFENTTFFEYIEATPKKRRSEFQSIKHYAYQALPINPQDLKKGSVLKPVQISVPFQYGFIDETLKTKNSNEG